MERMNRREFFKFGALAGGVMATSTLASSHNMVAKEHGKPADNASNINGRMTFQRDEDFEVLCAACERIYPKDSTGPGAIELGAPYFIDNQLAAAWGYNAREYTSAPFSKGIPEQGYQSAMYKRDVILSGIERINQVSKALYDKGFVDIDNESKDKILLDFQNGLIDMEGISSSEFFTLFRDLTIAGVLSDPIYGGNANKMGWEMMQYPGAQMSYLNDIDKDEFVYLKPMGLRDM